MSENERKEVIPICQLFHTSAKTLSERLEKFTFKLKLNLLIYSKHWILLIFFKLQIPVGARAP